MPQNVLFFTKDEVVSLVRSSLELGGRDVSNAVFQFSSEGVHADNCPEIVKVSEPCDPCSCCDDEDDDDDGEEGELSTTLRASVLEHIEHSPATCHQIAMTLSVESYEVSQALSELGDKVAKVAPAREDGRTVSEWMATGSDEFDVVMDGEEARIDAQVAEWKDHILATAPAFYERRIERPALLEKLVESVDGALMKEGAQEEIRRDCRAIFYAMAEKGMLQHQEHGWRVAKTDADRIKVASIQGGIREILMSKQLGRSTDEIVEALPEPLPKGLVRHCLRHMDDVYKECGRHYLR
ncbi:MAG: hypothetical protein KAJ19_21400 [Gammaproteobacteria bacterium]|nr:hypothetical protein [Gammaproteobacteria bacterium]